MNLIRFKYHLLGLVSSVCFCFCFLNNNFLFHVQRLLVVFHDALPLAAKCVIDPKYNHTEYGKNAGCLIVYNEKEGTMISVVHDSSLISRRYGVAGLIGYPGGSGEIGELSACTAQRETEEESGIEVSVGEILHVFDNDFHLYRCYPRKQLTKKDLLYKRLFEVEGLVAMRPDELLKNYRNRLRFPYQYEFAKEYLDNGYRVSSNVSNNYITKSASNEVNLDSNNDNKKHTTTLARNKTKNTANKSMRKNKKTNKDFPKKVSRTKNKK